MRTFGVEEELLLVDAVSYAPVPAAEQLAPLQTGDTGTGHEITREFKQEQVEVVSPPQTSFTGQLETIQTGRALAEAAAAQVGTRVVALSTAPEEVRPHLVDKPRNRDISKRFGLTSTEQLTCACHVQVDSREEGVAVLDRIRVWLPVLLALGANSPFWQGTDSGFASYRYQVWNRWPLTGPTDYFGSVSAYERHHDALFTTPVPLDEGMVYFDARLCAHQPTLEVRVTDVSLEAEQSAAIATIVRALVETASRAWQAGAPAPRVDTAVLRAWSWQASSNGLEGQLLDPGTGAPAPAADVVAALLASIRPVLVEYGEDAAVTKVVTDLLRRGSGARRQRETFAARHDPRDVVSFALEATHRGRAVRYSEQ